MSFSEAIAIALQLDSRYGLFPTRCDSLYAPDSIYSAPNSIRDIRARLDIGSPRYKLDSIRYTLCSRLDIGIPDSTLRIRSRLDRYRLPTIVHSIRYTLSAPTRYIAPTRLYAPDSIAIRSPDSISLSTLPTRFAIHSAPDSI
ncbi:hypothetical protein Baya_16140 [Bagarius yarrelli]|uniref:Uncharacterized protein n=1 Tax=Bagarius yarrelli TaxID=175774 RepID=A0A556VUN7_BAGYA|nr:hypothetical protein Baya_16140 [Bagarius yarrelli]